VSVILISPDLRIYRISFNIGEHTMRTKLICPQLARRIIRPLLAAALGLAITFTLSCSSGDDPSGGSSGDSGGGSSSSKGNDIANYKTVKIGNQVWMAENLNYNAEGSKCYDNDPANCGIYGRLYNWATAMALPPDCNSSSCSFQISAKHKGICPSGWHIPSDAEWQTLVNFAGGNEIAGKKLKTKNEWKSGNGDDAYGFSALPGGLGVSGGYFLNVGNYGFWWSASEYDSDDAYYRGMHYSSEDVYYFSDFKSGLLSVRCLQD
jgi:uncharacterized protein (TIGR02145 family)